MEYLNLLAEPSHLDLHYFHFDFRLKALFASAVGMSNFKNRRVHVRNSGGKG